jgi:hypothetical protein
LFPFLEKILNQLNRLISKDSEHKLQILQWASELITFFVYVDGLDDLKTISWKQIVSKTNKKMHEDGMLIGKSIEDSLLPMLKHIVIICLSTHFASPTNEINEYCLFHKRRLIKDSEEYMRPRIKQSVWLYQLMYHLSFYCFNITQECSDSKFSYRIQWYSLQLAKNITEALINNKLFQMHVTVSE